MPDGNKVAWPPEMLVAMTGSAVAVGTLTYNPSILIFDNQSTASVTISVNDPTGATVWKTFVAGEGLILDFKTNKGVADTFSASIGDTFYAIGTNSSGNFSIAGVFAT